MIALTLDSALCRSKNSSHHLLFILYFYKRVFIEKKIFNPFPAMAFSKRHVNSAMLFLKVYISSAMPLFKSHFLLADVLHVRFSIFSQ